MSKEEVYDADIEPLMAEIIKISKANEIAMFAHFELDGELDCTTAIPDGQRDRTISALTHVAVDGWTPHSPHLVMTVSSPPMTEADDVR